MNNKVIRKEAMTTRENLTSEVVAENSTIITSKIIENEIYKNAAVVMSYIGFRNEVDTVELNRIILESGKRLIIPRISDKGALEAVEINSYNDLTTGTYGLMEPKKEFSQINKEVINLIIVPGVAFDINCNRLGFGKGYYDRFLKDYTGIKAAIAHEIQIYNLIDAKSHDIPMDYIITEKRIIKKSGHIL